MGFLSFLVRHLSATVVGSIGLILLALGYADQAFELWETLQPWHFHPLGAALFVIAVLTILYKWDQEHHQKSPSSHAVTAAPRSTLEDRQALSLGIGGSNPEKNKDRIYVSDRLTAKTLVNLYEGRTTAQGARVVQPYLNKWMRVSGQFKDLNIKDWGARVILERPADDVYLFLVFREDVERLEMLHPGDVITVEGRIDTIDKTYVELSDCELLNS